MEHTRQTVLGGFGCHGLSYGFFWNGIRIHHSRKPDSDGEQWANDNRDRDICTYSAVGNVVVTTTPVSGG